MKILGIIEEDFVNYKEPCMTIEFPHCDFKCDKENGNQICQNYALSNESCIELSFKSIINKYTQNNITKAIVFQGLEPFYDFNELKKIVKEFRAETKDIIIIYTGYTENEIKKEINCLKQFSNIIVKFGRYIPNQKSHYDEILGVKLASNNQYAEVIC